MNAILAAGLRTTRSASSLRPSEQDRHQGAEDDERPGHREPDGGRGSVWPLDCDLLHVRQRDGPSHPDFGTVGSGFSMPTRLSCSITGFRSST